MGFIPGLSNDFNAQEANTDTSKYGGAVAQNLANDEDARRRQAALAAALEQQALGKGPSLAQHQLTQGLDQITAQGAGLIASQRGMNPGLQAKMIMDQANAARLNAAGQSAGLRLQEEQNARAMQGQNLAAMRGGDAQGVATAGQLQNQQNANAINNRSQANAINAGVAGQNTETTKGVVGGLASAAGGVAGLADGGEVEEGFQRPERIEEETIVERPHRIEDSHARFVASLAKELASAKAPVNKPWTRGGKGEPWTRTTKMSAGGEAAPVDDPANDTVPAMLSPHEIVLPVSVAQAENAPERAAAFVASIKKGKGGAEPGSYEHVLERKRQLQAELEHLEAMEKGGRG